MGRTSLYDCTCVEGCFFFCSSLYVRIGSKLLKFSCVAAVCTCVQGVYCGSLYVCLACLAQQLACVYKVLVTAVCTCVQSVWCSSLYFCIGRSRNFRRRNSLCRNFRRRIFCPKEFSLYGNFTVRSFRRTEVSPCGVFAIGSFTVYLFCGENIAFMVAEYWSQAKISELLHIVFFSFRYIC